jgi:anti-sigma regulatory factor (Ser/Thr protein kinase)
VTVAAIEGSAPAIALALPFEVASVWHARRRLAMDLRTVGVPEDRIEDAVLILSELFGNALRHARPLPPGMVRVAWSFLPGAVEISVTDGGGPTHPRVLNLPVSALGGRGLAIVSDLSATWGVRREGRGTTVYAVLSLR